MKSRQAFSSFCLRAAFTLLALGCLPAVAAPGPIVQLIWATQPTNAITGQPFCTQPVLETADANGVASTSNLFPVINVAVALSSGTGMLLGITNLNIGAAGFNGVVNFTNLQINTVGAGYQLTAAVYYATNPPSVPVLWLDANAQSSLVLDVNSGINNWTNLGTRAGRLGISTEPNGNPTWTGPTNVLNSMNGRPVARFISANPGGGPNGAGEYGPGNVLTNSWPQLDVGPDIHVFTAMRMPGNPLGNWSGFIGFSLPGTPCGKGDATLAEDSGWSTNGFRIFRNDNNTSPAYANVGQFTEPTFANGIGYNFGEGNLGAWYNLRPANNVAFINGFYYQGSASAGADYWVDQHAGTWTNFQVSTHNYGNFNISDFGLGSQFDSPNTPVDGPAWPLSADIAEVLVYTNVLNVTDRAALENYLQGKWLATFVTNAVSATFSVITNQLPGITCPANITVLAATGQCGSNVTFSVVATNSCGAAIASVSVPASGSLFPVGTNTVISTATDAYGNSNQCSFTVTVIDTQAPTVFCSTNITVNAAPGLCGSNVTFSVTATDNCAIATIVSSPPSGSFFAVGTNTVTTTATDVHGNVNQCTFTVTVKDTQVPVITAVPPTLTVPASLGFCYATNVTLGSLSATDNCTVVTITNNAPTHVPVGTNSITWTATDGHGNQTNYQQTVIVQDTQPPAITCPANITVNAATGLCGSNVTFSVTATDNCTGAVTPVSVPASGSLFPVGVTTVTNTATDTHGNTSQCTFTVTVNDAQPPIITAIPPTVTVPASLGFCYATNVALGTLSASDNCAGVTITNNATAQFPVGTNLVVWTVADGNGNLTNYQQTVIVQDTQPPTITCPTNLTVAPDAGTNVATHVSLGTPSTTDNCPGVSVTNNAPAFFPLGTNSVTWTVTDLNGNQATCPQQVVVASTQAPTIACPSAVTVSTDTGACVATVVALGSPNVADGCTSSVTNNALALFPTGYPVGTNLVTWTLTDQCNNTNTCQQNVIVQDTQPPMINTNADLPAPAALGFCYATNVVLTPPTATDNCLGVSVSSNVPAQFVIGTNLVIWTATDASGNTASSVQNVIVQDTQPPTIATNADLTVPANLGVCYATNVSLVIPNASDNCARVSVTNNAPAQFLVGTNIVTWTAVDASGNTATSTQNVIVQDTQRPSINCPADMVVVADQNQCYATGVSVGTASGSDNCGAVDIENNAVAQFAVGVDTVLWTAEDPSGNFSFCVQQITVLDTQPPTISCPPDLTLTNTSPVSNVDLGQPSASDNCSVTNVTNNAPATFPVGTTIVKWTATDASGNTANCEQRVTVGASGSGSLLTATRNPDGSLTLNYTGVASQQYHVQVSSNLAPSPNWMNLPGSTNQAAGNGAYTFTDTNTATFHPRFYRTVSP